jgi:hypothetical protein
MTKVFFNKITRCDALAILAPVLVTGVATAQTFQNQTASKFAGLINTEYSNQASPCDIDDDGDLDLVWANGQGFGSQGAALKVRVWINDGAGVFTDETDARTGGLTGWFRGVEFGDIERDGDWDMILAQDFNKQPQLLVNDGKGFFTNETAARLPAATLSSARGQFGDVDNDGDLDLFMNHSGATNRFGSGPPRLYLNDGTGVFTNASLTNLPAGNTTDQQDAIFGDVDGDLDLDVLVVSRDAATKLWINDGAGVFTNKAMPADGSSYSFDMGDINGDGDLDLLSAEGGVDKLFENNGTGTYTNASSKVTGNPSADDNDSKFFDLDNDGDLDFVIGSLSSNGERIFRNNGPKAAPQFTAVTGAITALVDSSLDIEVADFTGDGRYDIVTAQGESGGFQNKIYVGNSGGAAPMPVDTLPPTIIATEQLPDADVADGPFFVRVVAYDGYTSDRGFYDKGVFLNYTVDGVAGDNQVVEMKWHGNSMWRGEIPQMENNVEVSYFVTATDWNGNVGTGPTLTFNVTGADLFGDLDGDGDVDGADLGLLLAAWDTADPVADLNGDGNVDGADLGLLLAAWS